VCLAGCAAPEKKATPTVEDEQARLAERELDKKISNFVDFFDATVEQATIEIERRTGQQEHRRAAALWRVRMGEQCRSYVNQDDPREAMVDLWTLCQRQVDYFSVGEGKTLFGEHQPIALTAAKEIYSAIEKIARSYVPEDEFDAAVTRVVEYARENPMQGQFGGEPHQRLSDEPEIQSKLAEMAALPLAPLTALRGVGKTPDSVRDVSRSMDRFTDVVEDLPSSTRWQAQLLAMNLEELPTVSNASASFKELADSSAQFVEVVDAMPEKVREQTEAVLDRMDKSHPELRSTLDETQKTLELVRTTNHDVKETVIEAEKTVAGVGEAAAALEDLANAVTITVQEIQKLVPKKAKAPAEQAVRPVRPADHDDRHDDVTAAPKETALSADDGAIPSTLSAALNNKAESPQAGEDKTTAGKDTRFSFQAVTESANALGETSLKLQALLLDLRAFVDAKSISQESDAISAAISGVVDHVAKRAAQLLFLLFFLLLVYAFVRKRLQRNDQRPAGP
jgi:hypothetical protein